MARFLGVLALASTFGVLQAAPPARAQQYILSAQAGGNGDSNESLDDPDAEADFLAEGATGNHSYHADASADGALSAVGQKQGTPPSATITLGATAKIAETILIGTSPFPTGPVAITLGIGGTTSASATSGPGAARSSLQVLLDNGACVAGTTNSSASGVSSGGSCNFPGSSANGNSVTRVFTLQELSARGWKVNIEGQASVSLHDAGNLAVASARADGALWVNVAGDATYSFHGTQTSLPAPEPSAASRALAAIASLCVAARSMREGRRGGGGGVRARQRAGARCRARELRSG